MDSFIDARGGGTILWSSTFTAPVGILFKHYIHQLGTRPGKVQLTWPMIRRDSLNSCTRHKYRSSACQQMPETSRLKLTAVAILAYGHIELDLVICVVGSNLADRVSDVQWPVIELDPPQIPWYATPPQHDP